MRNVFIHKKPDTFQKVRQFLLCFYIQRARHFTWRDFSWMFWNWHVYTKRMTLFVTWCFNIQNPDTSQKEDNLRYIFIYKNPDTLCYAIIHRIFEICGGGAFLFAKNSTLCVTFLCAKNALWVTFLHTKIQTLCVTFLYPKNGAFFFTFYI